MHVICDFLHKFTEVLVTYSPPSDFSSFSPWEHPISLWAFYCLSLFFKLFFNFCFLFLIFSFGFLAFSLFCLPQFFSMTSPSRHTHTVWGIRESRRGSHFQGTDFMAWHRRPQQDLQWCKMDTILFVKPASCIREISFNIPVSIYPYSSLLGGSLLGKSDSPSLCKSLRHPQPYHELWFTWLAFSRPYSISTSTA